MAVTLVTRFRDSESDTNLDSLALTFPATPTLATIQAYSDGWTQLLDAVSGAQIVEANAVYSLTLPGPLKGAPTAGHFNERGGLIGFETSIPGANDSIRVPAILNTIMPGNEFAITEPAVAALIAYVIAPQSGIEAVNRWVASYETAIYGRKSRRRK